jgi:hypothetical protein
MVAKNTPANSNTTVQDETLVDLDSTPLQTRAESARVESRFEALDPTTRHKKYVKSTPPTFSYPGGKARMAMTIVALAPYSGRLYIEPFAGRGNVFWKAAGVLNYKEWQLNDIRTADWFESIRGRANLTLRPSSSTSFSTGAFCGKEMS